MAIEEHVAGQAAAPATAAGRGRVRAQVGAHLKPVTRFSAADLVETQPEQALALAVTVMSEQQLAFSIGTARGSGALPAGTRKLASEAAVDETLQAWLATAREQAPQALQRWAAGDAGSYRRLLPAAAGFLTAPGSVGHEQACATCAGACRLACEACHGQGRRRCTGCHGDGRVTCPSCQGIKRSNCISCNGRGQWNDQEVRQVWDGRTGSWVGETHTTHNRCLACGATGITTCDRCGPDARVACTGCAGSGQLNCTACRASGRVDCGGCAASGLQHRTGTLVAQVTRDETLALATDDAALQQLVRQHVPLDALPGLGQLLRVRHDVTGATVRSIHELQLDVRRGHLRAGAASFVLHGFGPQTQIFSFENIAARLLAEDLAALEHACGIGGGPALLAALGDFLRSELNLLLSERMDDAGAAAEPAAQAVGRQFAGLVDADYITRATAALRRAVGRVYAAQLIRPALGLVGLVAVAAVVLLALGRPLAHPAAAVASALGGAAVAWRALEWWVQRRIRAPFGGDFGHRLVGQLSANGSVRRWRLGVGAAAVAASVGAVWLAASWLPAAWHGTRHAAASAAAPLQVSGHSGSDMLRRMASMK